MGLSDWEMDAETFRACFLRNVHPYQLSASMGDGSRGLKLEKGLGVRFELWALNRTETRDHLRKHLKHMPPCDAIRKKTAPKNTKSQSNDALTLNPDPQRHTLNHET